MTDAHSFTGTTARDDGPPDPIHDDGEERAANREIEHLIREIQDYTQNSTEAKEVRTLEYLLTGNGNVFSNDPGVAAAGEGNNWTSSKMSHFQEHYHRQQLFDYLWWMYQAADPTARNIINAYVVFIRGGGADIKIATKAGQKKWDKWADENEWDLKERKIIKGVSLFGEVFIVLSPKKGPQYTLDGERLVRSERTGPAIQGGKPSCHILNSIEVKEVYCDPGNPEHVLAYQQVSKDGTTVILHAAENVCHFTFDTLPNCVRGHPMLLTVLQPLYYYRTFLTNRHWLNMIRSRVPLIISKQKGGAKEITALKSAFGSLPAPGTVMVLNSTTSADFPSLNIGAADAKDDAKQILRTIAMGTGLPEIIVSADASSGNYSSSLVAENPAMRTFKDIQAIVSIRMRKIVSRLIGVKTSQISIRFPEALRGFKDLVSGLDQMHKSGVLSDQTYAEKAGFDYLGPDGEKARIESQQGFSAATPMPVQGLLPGMPKPEQPNKGEIQAGKGRGTPPGNADPNAPKQ